mmetsp:Transcript_24555/g.30015  ORF Transcript_24555/g.30015 Transcript_24555/m.30015 type:complete len:409 (-) Transcript_24555:1390-2616(-)
MNKNPSLSIQPLELKPGSDYVEDTCYSKECGTRVWCFAGPRRHIDFSKVFGEIELRAEFPADTPACILVESEDTFFKLSSFVDKNTVTERIESKIAEGFSVKRKLSTYTSQSFGFGVFSSCDGSANGNVCSELVSPYGRSCISLCGQSVSGEVKISLSYKHSRLKYPFFLLLGILIFLAAPHLSNKIVFYYTFGTSFGTLLSVLLIVFFVLKRALPRKNSFFSLFIAAIAQSLFGVVSHFRGWWENMLNDHIEFVFLYLTVTALMSFALTHWLLKGPEGVTVGAGLQDIFRAAIRMCGVGFIGMSSRSLTWSISLVVVSITSVLAYSSFVNMKEDLLDRLYPKRGIAEMKNNYLYGHKFMSNEEYEMQSKIETEKQMKLLVQNPEFQKWAIRNIERLRVDPPSPAVDD